MTQPTVSGLRRALKDAADKVTATRDTVTKEVDAAAGTVEAGREQSQPARG